MDFTIYLYIITISMTSAFALSPWLPLPLLLSMTGLIMFFLRIMIFGGPIKFFREDLLLYFYLLILIISTLFSSLTQKNINHLFSYFVIFILYLFTIRSLIICTKFNRKKVYDAIIISVVLVSSFAILEFVSKNIIPELRGLNNYVYRPNLMLYEPLYAGKFVRARSFIGESGHAALYLNLLGPIAVYWTAKNYSRILLFFVSILLIVSFIFTFSTAGVFSLLISSILTSAYFMSYKIIKKELSSHIIFKGIIIISIIFAIFIIVSFQMPELLMPIVNKILIPSTSESGRLARWGRAIQYFITSPIIGIGPGEISVKYSTGTVNWYLEILIENGVIAFFIMFSFILTIYFRISILSDEIKFIYFLCFTNGVIHYFFISNYWYPWLWLIILLIEIESLKTSWFSGV